MFGIGGDLHAADGVDQLPTCHIVVSRPLLLIRKNATRGLELYSGLYRKGSHLPIYALDRRKEIRNTFETMAFDHRLIARRLAPTVIAAWTCTLIIGWLAPCCTTHAMTGDPAPVTRTTAPLHDCGGGSHDQDRPAQDNGPASPHHGCCDQTIMAPSVSCGVSGCHAATAGPPVYQAKADLSKDPIKAVLFVAPDIESRPHIAAATAPPIRLAFFSSTPRIYLLTRRLRE